MKAYNLLEETLTALNQDRTPLLKLSEDADVSHRWLYSIKSGATTRPSVITVQKLHDYLLNKRGGK